MSGAGGRREKVLIKGAGEQASATGLRLFRCGYRVVMTDLERPTAIRRTVSFCSAIYEGAVEIEGVRGLRCRRDEVGGPVTSAWHSIPVVVDPEGALVAEWHPDVIVDARILKQNVGNRRGDAPLVIGLGPGLVAGRDVDFVVETNRGHDLGRIIVAGEAEPDTRVPGEIGGFTRERLIVAPIPGVFESRLTIAQPVAAGEVIGTIAGTEVRAAIAGVLRGLAWPGLEVTAGQKVGDVDPRGDPSYCYTLSDKARALSGSVLEIVVAHAGRAAQHDS